MNLISLDSLGHSSGDRALFSDLSVGIDEDEHVALIGANGAGKSTLLAIVFGASEPERGRVVRKRDLHMALLRQRPEFAAGQRVGDILIATEVSSETARRRHTVLQGLGAPSPERVLSELSGGELRKAELARVLLSGAELLLLDEPTNHLDVDSILWLEAYLRDFPGAFLLVTHDRYFLDRVVHRILELDRGKMHQTRGSYSDYLEARAAREAALALNERQARSFLRKESEWLRRQPKARGTKQKARIDRIRAVEERDRPQQKRSLQLESDGQRLGNKILELKDIGKRFGARSVFSGFTRYFREGERLGIAGPNGAGKSTLLAVIGGRLAPDEGEVIVGVNTRIAYFDQQSMEMPEEQKVIDFVQTQGTERFNSPAGARSQAARLLEQFLFDENQQYVQIKQLSGGERRRLQLVCLLMHNPNFLILDEPTNDLDIDTLSALEEFLEQFRGVVLAVSHDRYFMDRVVDELLILDGQSDEIAGHVGPLSEYLAQRSEQVTMLSEDRAGVADLQRATEKDRKVGPKIAPQERRRQVQALERRIAALEEEERSLRNTLSGGETLAERIAAAAQRHPEVERELAELLERWSELAG
ncbi:MAG: ABC-F family ATP-binding cassette domain-containing protein [Leptospirales bacterium]|nr:ABC-F family ATP-binding cassette domain-containing protein [Leptospirales bacterium]